MFVGNILSLVWVSEAHRDMRAKPFSSFYFASGSLEVKLEEVKGRRIEESGKLYSQSHQVRPRGMWNVSCARWMSQDWGMLQWICVGADEDKEYGKF